MNARVSTSVWLFGCAAFIGLSGAVACSGTPAPPPQIASDPPPLMSTPVTADAATVEAPHTPVTLSIIGTNDVHGHIDALPIFGGFLNALRAKVTPDNVVLLDAGDMFQGTLESNLGEGAAVVRAYNVLQYDAVAIGNHEFDFGPVGASAVPRAPADDPRGALRERAKQANFPFLIGNVQDTKTSATP